MFPWPNKRRDPRLACPLRMLPTRMDKNGRITIPLEIRNELDLKPGQLFGVESRNNGEIIVRKARLIPEKQ